MGMREIIDIKHGGLETWGFSTEYLGTSVPVEKVLDAAIEHAAQVVLISTIITTPMSTETTWRSWRIWLWRRSPRSAPSDCRRHPSHRRTGPHLGNGRRVRQGDQGDRCGIVHSPDTAETCRNPSGRINGRFKQLTSPIALPHSTLRKTES